MKKQLDFADVADSSGLNYNFQPFTPQEIEQHLALYMIQGLNPSPQLILKTRSQNIEPTQDNDLINKFIGDNFQRRHKQFKRYFAVHHPFLAVRDTRTHPN